MDKQILIKYADELLNNPVFLAGCDEINRTILRELDKVDPAAYSDMQALVIERRALNRMIDYFAQIRDSQKIDEYNRKVNNKGSK